MCSIRHNVLAAAWISAVLCTHAGCGASNAVSRDGSPGTLTFGTHRVGDLCVVVHQQAEAGFREVGFGTTDQAGSFRLLRNGGQEPLTLEPGEYRITLESVGPSIVFPEAFLKPETTPLRVLWTAETTSLDLLAPESLLADLPESSINPQRRQSK